MVAEGDAVAQLRDGLSPALEANGRLAVLVGELSGENAGLRERLAQCDVELEQMAAELAVLKRMVSGRSPVKGREPAGQGEGGQDGAGGGTPRKRGRAGNSRGDYSHLPRFEIIWDFEDGSYCCPRCGQLFTVLGDHVIEQVGWQVIVGLVVHRRRRYRRSCRCPVPATVMAPGPPEAIGEGLLSNGFIAQAWCER
ncbi:MAG: hypothetical protein ACT4NY_22175 [Pseudonocardiales bacterium]